jgi:DNA polymerase-1
MDQSIQNAKQHGYTKTLLGRKRYLRDINSGNATIRGFAERNAINAPIQGTAADMIKIAMIDIAAKMKKEQFQSKMILQVHDELLFDVYKPELERLSPLVESCMENAIEMLVPLEVGIGTGNNWLEAH